MLRLRWRAAVVCVLACGALAIGTVLQAEDAPGESRNFVVSVTDRDGNAVTGLGPESFRGKYRGDAVTIVSAKPDETPLFVASIVVATGSFSENVPYAWRTVADVAGRLLPHNSVSVMSARERIEQHSPFTNDKVALAKAIAEANRAPAWGRSSLNELLLTTTTGYRGPAGRGVVCMITDGADSTSQSNWDALRGAIAGSGVRVFVVLFRATAYQDATPEVMARAVRWAEMAAQATGGDVLILDARAKDGDPKTLQRLVGEMTSTYRLEVTLPRKVEKPGEWDLELVGPEGRKRKDVVVVFQRRLEPATPAGQ